MNRKIMSIASVLMAVITLAFFSSCKEEEPAQKPEFNWSGDKVVDGVFNAAAEANQYVLEYAIKNAVEGASVEAVSDKDWISIVAEKSAEPSVSNGALTFAVTANEGEVREGRITLKYPDMADQVLTVMQAAAGTDPDPDPDPSGDDFVIEITEPDISSLYVKVTPKDESMTYITFIVTEEQLIADGAMEDDAALVAADEAFMIADAEMYGETLDQTFEFYAHMGVFEGPASGLSPKTRYVVYSYGAKIEGGKLVNTTKVYRKIGETKDFERTPVDFNFDIKIDGPIVDMTVTAVDYEGYFFFDLIEEPVDDATSREQAVSILMQMVEFYKMFGYEPADILTSLCAQGEGNYVYELKGETPYHAYALAVDENCNPCSEVALEPFTTGVIEPSDNQITIAVNEIQARQVHVTMTPTNDDPYTAVLYETAELEGLTEQEIIDLCVEIGPVTVTGPQDQIVGDLSPETGYSVLCFGCVSNTPTTKLFRKDFTTTEAVEGTATISVTWSDYYDIAAVSEIDPGFERYLESGDFFLPLNVVTDPVDAEVYYYCAYSEETLAEYEVENTDEALTEDLLSYGPAAARDDAYILSYGEHNFIVAIVQDANGNLSKLWRSEVFVLQAEGASDPQSFLDKYGAPARMPKVKVPFAPEISEPMPIFGIAVSPETVSVQNELVKFQDIDLSKAPRARFAAR